MSAIDRVRADLYFIPLDPPLTDAMHGVMRGFEIVTVRVTDADGAEGVGYTFTCGRGGGAILSIARDELPDIVVGEDAGRIEWLWHRVWWALHYGARGGAQTLAQSAFDIALHDLAARKAGQPLWRHLGGFDPALRAYAGGIDLGLSAAELIEQTDRNLANGHRAIKMKVGRDRLSEDVEKVAAMRAHLGEGFPLMVDANMKYTADAAVRAARAFAPYDLTWFEEPVEPEDLGGHARVVREGGVAVATGENLRLLADFRAFIAAGAVTYPEPDVTNCGGVTVFMKVARLAEAFGLPVTSHGAHDITVHLLAACSNASYLEAHGFGLDAFIEHPMEVVDGVATAPERPGHGMVFDWQGLERMRP